MPHVATNEREGHAMIISAPSCKGILAYPHILNIKDIFDVLFFFSYFHFFYLVTHHTLPLLWSLWDAPEWFHALLIGDQ